MLVLPPEDRVMVRSLSALGAFELVMMMLPDCNDSPLPSNPVSLDAIVAFPEKFMEENDKSLLGRLV